MPSILAQLPPDEQRKVLALAAASIKLRTSKPPRTLFAHQRPPEGDWDVWMLLGGRGSGKTEAGARYVDAHAQGPACLAGKVPHRIAVVAPSHDDAVDTCVRGDSGLLRTNPAIRFRPGAQLTADLTWPNGAEAELFGTFAPEDVERFRGPQHCLIWGDEFASWRKLDESWDMLQFGLRLGSHPHAILTTTPKRKPLLTAMIADPKVRVVKATTDDNPALNAERRAALYARYGGTTLGRQELEAEVLADVAGALWRRDMIEVARRQSPPDLRRIVVAIDPSATSTESADECGIVVAGTDGSHGYVLADLSLRASPVDWANLAVAAFRQWGADRIVAETNNGGEMVEAVIRTIDASVPYRAVTASRGKRTRAEPIAALYEQGRVHHVGTFEALEDQQCGWDPETDSKSPDRMDALVWALTELMVGKQNPWAALESAGGVA